ncbi:unnamed protein product [Kuraishia capsulata CBS 1993]|uniref:DNA2/NAM7 helicase-like C-terminal domain-containing protein n=1 Tax=Kuraishia capsulata CBS 1993 TaxID=1382522 RepID=W6MUE6_9ASCO|nr:uncharacterized protein KUCA_T00005190001 [Kuraishia capsulata CBS 1993]CDK29202.1 unnamed protein product [Kuraishia capsulata CBS 1993]
MDFHEKLKKVEKFAHSKWNSPKQKTLDNTVTQTIYSELSAEPPVPRAYLDVLVRTKYVQNWLWRYFHRDISESHLLSLVILANYHPQLLVVLLDDKVKTRELLARLISQYNSTNSINSKVLILGFWSNVVSFPSNSVPWDEIFGVLALDDLEYHSTVYEKELEEAKIQFESLGDDEKGDSYMLKGWMYTIIEIAYHETVSLTDKRLRRALFVFLLDSLSNKRCTYLSTLLFETNIANLRWCGEVMRKDSELIALYDDLIYGLSHFKSPRDQLLNIQKLAIQGNFDKKLDFVLDTNDPEMINESSLSKLTEGELKELSVQCRTSSKLFDSMDTRKGLMIALLPQNARDRLYDLRILPTSSLIYPESALSSNKCYFSKEDLFYRKFLSEKANFYSEISSYLAKIIGKPAGKSIINLISEVEVQRTSRPIIDSETNLSVILEIILEKGNYDTLDVKGNSLKGSPVLLLAESGGAASIALGGELISVQREKSKRKIKVSVGSDVDDEFVKNLHLVTRLPKALKSKFEDLKSIKYSFQHSETVAIPDWIADTILGAENARPVPGPSVFKFGSVFESYPELEKSLASWEVTLETQEQQPGQKKRKGAKFEGNSTAESPFLVRIGKSKAKVVPYESIAGFKNDLELTLSSAQTDAMVSILKDGLVSIEGLPGTGKNSVLASAISIISSSFPKERVLIIGRSNGLLEKISSSLESCGLTILNLCKASNPQLPSLLEQVDHLAESLGIVGEYGNDPTSAAALLEEIERRWTRFLETVHSRGISNEVISEEYPFVYEFDPSVEARKNMLLAISNYNETIDLFRRVEQSKFENLPSDSETLRANVKLIASANVVIMRQSHLTAHIENNIKFRFDSLFMLSSESLEEVDFARCFSVLSSQALLKRVVFVGTGLRHDDSALIVDRMDKFKGVKKMNLLEQYVQSGEIGRLIGYSKDQTKSLMTTNHFNPGFAQICQLIDVAEYNGRSPVSELSPGVFQNVAEAEYAVAIYTYMALLNYPLNQITILTSSNAQKSLIDEVASVRLGDQNIALPEVATTYEFEGQQQNYVIVSCVHGDLLQSRMELERLIASSGLGLYILGDFERLRSTEGIRLEQTAAETNLKLVEGEKHGEERQVKRKALVMKDLAQFGKLVHDMLASKID